jgi:hypothetical protein
MKHLWQMFALGAAAMGAGCADSATRPSLATSAVPATIIVPAITGSAAGMFEFNADGTRQYIQDAPGDGSGECYDVCDSSIDDGGGGDAGSGGDSYQDPAFQGARFTEAHFDGSVLKGHAEMTFIWADHATQDMTLATWRPEGSVIGSQKFTTARVWPLPVLIGVTLNTDGNMPAPACGARGQGTSVHDVSSSAGKMMSRRTETTFSTIMTQPACTSTQTTTQTTTTSSAGGQLRVCLRYDHYSSEGEYIYTETIYCYYTAAT